MPTLSCQSRRENLAIAHPEPVEGGARNWVLQLRESKAEGSRYDSAKARILNLFSVLRHRDRTRPRLQLGTARLIKLWGST